MEAVIECLKRTGFKPDDLPGLFTWKLNDDDQLSVYVFRDREIGKDSLVTMNFNWALTTVAGFLWGSEDTCAFDGTATRRLSDLLDTIQVRLKAVRSIVPETALDKMIELNKILNGQETEKEK